MSKWYDTRCFRFLAGAALLAGLFAAWGPAARAGTLQITISEGASSFTIVDNDPNDSNGLVNLIQAASASLNTGIFPDFTIVGLNASTNNPGADNPVGATLTVGGEIQRTTPGAAATLTITVTDTDYVIPSGAPPTLELHSSNSSTFTNVPKGDTSQFTSWFNPSNLPYATDVASPTLTLTSTGVTLNSSASTAVPVTTGSILAYGLTNTTVITLGGEDGSLVPDVVFGGSTQILSAVPEPASLSLLAAGLPLAIWSWYKRRRLSLGS